MTVTAPTRVHNSYSRLERRAPQSSLVQRGKRGEPPQCPQIRRREGSVRTSKGSHPRRNNLRPPPATALSHTCADHTQVYLLKHLERVEVGVFGTVLDPRCHHRARRGCQPGRQRELAILTEPKPLSQIETEETQGRASKLVVEHRAQE